MIGATLDPEGIAEEIGADSVNYLPVKDYIEATGMDINQLCLGCVTGKYPTPLANELAEEMKSRLEKGEPERGRIYEGY